MIESQNPDIDIALLNQKIDAALEQQKPVDRNTPAVAVETPESAARLSKLDSLEALVADANINAQGPQRWPQKLERFPFRLAKGSSAFALRLPRFLLKKQTVVNLAFVRSLQEMIQLLRQSTYLEVELQARCDRLSAQLHAEQTQRERLDARLYAEQSQREQLEHQFRALEAHVKERDKLRDAQQQHMRQSD